MSFKNNEKEKLEEWKKEQDKKIDKIFDDFNQTLIDSDGFHFDSKWSELKTFSNGEIKVRYMTEYVSNTEFYIHTYVKIEKFGKGIGREDDVNSSIYSLVSDISKIKGVIYVDTDSYSIRVKKGAIFNHEQLAANIAPFIGKYSIDLKLEKEIQTSQRGNYTEATVVNN